MFKNPINKGVINLKGVTFAYEIYISPINHSEETKTYMINKLGDRIKNGQVCLNVTKERVRTTIENNDYAAMAFVKNQATDDEASGALQYYDWCNSGEKQLWIGDLCRITNATPKPIISPVEAILDLFTAYAKHLQLPKIHLMVNSKDSENLRILTVIYKKYGFNKSPHCTKSGFLIMEKPLAKSGGSRRRKKTRRSRLAPIAT
jgi:hypothetical protein